jgi:hypothetical protein
MPLNGRRTLRVVNRTGVRSKPKPVCEDILVNDARDSILVPTPINELCAPYRLTICALSEDELECVTFLNDRDVASRSWVYPRILDAVSNGRRDRLANEHPSIIWCSRQIANYMWLQSVTVMLWREYKYRFGHECKAAKQFAHLTTHDSRPSLPSVATQAIAPPQTLPCEFRTTADANRWVNVINAFRDFYAMERSEYPHFQWERNRPRPTWLRQRRVDMETEVQAAIATVYPPVKKSPTWTNPNELARQVRL